MSPTPAEDADTIRAAAEVIARRRPLPPGMALCFCDHQLAEHTGKAGRCSRCPCVKYRPQTPRMAQLLEGLADDVAQDPDTIPL